MQGSKSSFCEKKQKQSRSFDDGYNGRHNNKKNDFHRQQRVKGNKQKNFE